MKLRTLKITRKKYCLAVTFPLVYNPIPTHCAMKSSATIQSILFRKIPLVVCWDSEPRTLVANVTHTSHLPVTILKVNSLRVECNINTGAYINGQRVHTIHAFFSAVPPGYKLVEVPSHVIYLPITVQAIDHIQLKLVD